MEALKSPAMMHGECVAVGCVAEAEVTLNLGIEHRLDRAKIRRITDCFASYGLPVHVCRRPPLHLRPHPRSHLWSHLWSCGHI